ncbi:hypothetical protein PG999_002941 [Apiospora kogelbergensis]|uniref:Clr5 domain-containing protein n=1 Tax=Apiospora kogelbergensis TaxID=1337665 RepID=A0AAW0R9Y4_9PEZI
MAEEHNFVATISQYEARFRKWQSPKNLTRHEWACLLKLYDQLATQKRNARIIAFGAIMNDARIYRARRHLRKEGVPRSRSIPASRNAFVEFLNDQGEWTRYSGHGRNADSPNNFMQVVSQRTRNQPRGFPSEYDVRELNPMGSIASLPATNCSSARPSSDTSSDQPMLFMNPDPIDRSSSLPANNILVPFAKAIQQAGNTWGTLTGPTQGLLKGRDIFIGLKRLLTCTTLLSNSWSIMAHPGRQNRPFIKALVYWIANGFPATPGVTRQSVFEHLSQLPEESVELFEYLESGTPYLARSIADNLFRAAVESCQSKTVAMVLEVTRRFSHSVIDVNNVKFTFEGLHCTPLTFAVRMQNVEVVKVLLSAEGDPNKCILGKNADICAFDVALHKGATIIHPPHKQFSAIHHLTDWDWKCSTSLAEAILSKDQAMIGYVEAQGALNVAVSNVAHFEPAFAAAARTNNQAYLTILLRDGPPVREILMDYALHIALTECNEEILALLLRADARPRVNNLTIALSQQNTRITQLLLDYAPGTHLRIQGTESSLAQLLLPWGNIKTLEEVLLFDSNFGGDFFDCGLCGISAVPLTHAVESGNIDVVGHLLKWEKQSVSPMYLRWYSPLAAAILRGDKIMARLIRSHHDITNDELAVLFAMERDDEVYHQFLSEFTTSYPSGRMGFGNFLLIRAMSKGHFVNLDQLLQIGLDVNSHSGALIYGRTHALDGNTTDAPLLKLLDDHREPSFNNDGSLRRFLEDQCVPQDGKVGRFTAFGFAINMDIQQDQLDSILRLFIKKGADLNGIALTKAHPHGKGLLAFSTPLLIAIDKRTTWVVELVLAEGADINRPAIRGVCHTPLQRACLNGDQDMVELLLRHGADISSAPARYKGRTALQAAAMSGNTRIIQLLLDNGADMHEEPGWALGRTAFEAAAEEGRIGVLEFLWNAGNPSLFGQDELQRARKFADAEGHRGCVEYIDFLALVVGDGRTPKLSFE